MPDTPESKPPFWSSLPGIFTGIGGVIVAVTGLIGALYQTGAIGSKPKPDAATPPSAATTFASTPADSRLPMAENSRYKLYEGEWAVTEKPSLDFPGTKEVKWIYKATVSGDVLTFAGRVSKENKGLPKGAEDVNSTVVVKLVDSKRMATGEYRTTNTLGDYDLPVTLHDVDPPRFEASIQRDGKVLCLLKGRKQ